MFMISLYFITKHIDNKDGVGTDSLRHTITLIHMGLAKNLWENLFIFFSIVCFLAFRIAFMSYSELN